jgi:glucan phosphoethanolaminetransferase (alkaline phosphatase superfamily)
MIGHFLHSLQQPEYVHVLLNPLPIYGLAAGLFGLIVALFLRSRPAQIATLSIVLVSAAAALPVYRFGEEGYDIMYSKADTVGDAWLSAHKERAEHLIWFFYVLALLSAVAIVAPIKWPRSSIPLTMAVLLFGAVVFGMGSYIAYAGGRVRHPEFRHQNPPPIEAEHD